MLIAVLASACAETTAFPDATTQARDATQDGGGTADAQTYPDASIPDATVDAGVLPLSADPGPDRYAGAGELITLDGSASTGAATYQWFFGDGRAWPAPRPTATATVTYSAPGRYRAVLTVFDTSGNRRSRGVLISVTHPVTFRPSYNNTIAKDGRRAAVVSPDSNELVLVDLSTPRVIDRIRTESTPRSVTAFAGGFAVSCQDAGVVQLVSSNAQITTIRLPRGSRPFGLAAAGASLWVTLQGLGEIAEIQGSRVVRRLPAVEDARGIAILPDGRIAVSRWRSIDGEGLIVAVDPTNGAIERWTLAFDPQIGSDTEIGGVPTYLDQILVSPNGKEIAIPSLQANLGEGTYRSQRPLSHETTVRAIVSFLELPSGAEQFERRKQFDDRGFAGSAVWSSRGDYLFVAMRGNGTIERFDRLDSNLSGTILDVGFAPAGLLLDGDTTLLADVYLSRELQIYDVTNFDDLPVPEHRLPIVSSEPLDPQILRGKILFNNSNDPRISRDGYVTCSVCHLDGDSDSLVWDFTDRGEGLRNTISLLGKSGADGPIHWSGNFDEIQDFEHDIRGAFAGTGLMDDADYHSGTRDRTLGDPKAGASADLDALAAYVSSLSTELESPHAPNARGAQVFSSAGCIACHSGPRLTDSTFTSSTTPLLHDVGTISAASGRRLNGPLTGIDTPSLRGVFHSAPYFHDGSAATLSEVLARHAAQLSPADRADLEAHLRAIDGR